MSKYEAMRTNPANWTMRIVYCCHDDPRIVVRNLWSLGWTWNFGHAKVYMAIALAIVVFLAPPYLAWQFGVRSGVVIVIIIAVTLTTIVLVANRLALDPEM